MDETAMIIEKLITNFAQAQFEANKLPPIMQMMIMRGICAKYERNVLDRIIDGTIAGSAEGSAQDRPADEGGEVNA